MLMQVLLETTVLGVDLDLQTYLKVLIALYNESPILSKDSQILTETEKKQALILVYLLFKNDCGEADFNFGCDLLYEYVNADINNPSQPYTDQEIQESKKKRKKRHQQHHSQDNTSEVYSQPWGTEEQSNQHRSSRDDLIYGTLVKGTDPYREEPPENYMQNLFGTQ